MSNTESSAASVLHEALKQPTCSVEEAAEVLGISRGLAYAAARTGNLPVKKFGKRYRVITAALRRELGLDEAA